jgi:hypothetical protein
MQTNVTSFKKITYAEVHAAFLLVEYGWLFVKVLINVILTGLVF